MIRTPLSRFRLCWELILSSADGKVSCVLTQKSCRQVKMFPLRGKVQALKWWRYAYCISIGKQIIAIIKSNQNLHLQTWVLQKGWTLKFALKVRFMWRHAGIALGNSSVSLFPVLLYFIPCWTDFYQNSIETEVITRLCFSSHHRTPLWFCQFNYRFLSGKRLWGQLPSHPPLTTLEFISMHIFFCFRLVLPWGLYNSAD